MPNKDNKTEEKNYAHISHTHCWNQETPACGISKEKHSQCCLCDLKYGADEVKDTSLEGYREEYRKRFHDGDRTIGDRKNNFSTEDIYSKIEDFLISKILEVRKATEEKVRGEIEDWININSHSVKEGEFVWKKDIINLIRGSLGDIRNFK